MRCFRGGRIELRIMHLQDMGLAWAKERWCEVEGWMHIQAMNRVVLCLQKHSVQLGSLLATCLLCALLLHTDRLWSPDAALMPSQMLAFDCFQQLCCAHVALLLSFCLLIFHHACHRQ